MDYERISGIIDGITNKRKLLEIAANAGKELENKRLKGKKKYHAEKVLRTIDKKLEAIEREEEREEEEEKEKVEE